jgi:hypothetical protein
MELHGYITSCGSGLRFGSPVPEKPIEPIHKEKIDTRRWRSIAGRSDAMYPSELHVSDQTLVMDACAAGG